MVPLTVRSPNRKDATSRQQSTPPRRKPKPVATSEPGYSELVAVVNQLAQRFNELDGNGTATTSPKRTPRRLAIGSPASSPRGRKKLKSRFEEVDFSDIIAIKVCFLLHNAFS
jgi:hypothetical protein